MSLCMGCMTEKGNSAICPSCGLNEEELAGSNNVFLKPGTTLKDRYLLGIALGQGGFGITYIGYDNVLNTKVAIKEFYPSDIAGRVSADGTVSAYTSADDEYGRGKERFLEEARTLAKFSDHPCIVGVKDCFEMNNTAYMVMEFLEGISLKEYLKRKGGRLSAEESISLLTPVMDALRAVHKMGIIHRDISPDNIFVTTDGRVRLIDFGAARQSIGGQKSLSVMLKPGYAPEEQYRTRGNQGPWTDVYALTATLYRMITGSVPPDSLERVMEDTLEIPMNLPQYIQSALRIGLAVRAAERFSSIEQLQAALNNRPVANNRSAVPNSMPERRQPPVQYAPEKPNNTRGFLIGAIIAVSVILVVALAVVGIAVSQKGDADDTQLVDVHQEPAPEPPPPAPVFTSASASQITAPTSSNNNYGPNLVLDGDPATAWNTPGGPGDWIQFSAPTEQAVKGIKILNGYTKYSDVYGMWIYHANSRPKNIQISFSDGTSMAYTLSDTFDKANYIYQDISFGEYKKVTWIRITIADIYGGTKWSDCCISEVQFY